MERTQYEDPSDGWADLIGADELSCTDAFFGDGGAGASHQHHRKGHGDRDCSVYPVNIP